MMMMIALSTIIRSMLTSCSAIDQVPLSAVERLLADGQFWTCIKQEVLSFKHLPILSRVALSNNWIVCHDADIMRQNCGRALVSKALHNWNDKFLVFNSGTFPYFRLSPNFNFVFLEITRTRVLFGNEATFICFLDAAKSSLGNK